MNIGEHDEARKICPLCDGDGKDAPIWDMCGPFIFVRDWTFYNCCDLWRHKEKEEFFIASSFPDNLGPETFSREELERLKKLRSFQ